MTIIFLTYAVFCSILLLCTVYKCILPDVHCPYDVYYTCYPYVRMIYMEGYISKQPCKKLNKKASLFAHLSRNKKLVLALEPYILIVCEESHSLFTIGRIFIRRVFLGFRNRIIIINYSINSTLRSYLHS